MHLSVCLKIVFRVPSDARAELTASLNLLGKVAWMRLDNNQVRFTIVPEQGTQVWAFVILEAQPTQVLTRS